MSGSQCTRCGRVGPQSQMGLDYQFTVGTDPGDPVWVHADGFGCKSEAAKDRATDAYLKEIGRG